MMTSVGKRSDMRQALNMLRLSLLHDSQPAEIVKWGHFSHFPTETAKAVSPLQSQQEPIVEIGRVVTAIFVDHQGIGQCAQFQQSMPV